MLRLTQIVDSEVFWKVFHHCWSCCDDTWELNGALIHFLSSHDAEDPARNYMDRKQTKFYNCRTSSQFFEAAQKNVFGACLGRRTSR
jgi:hypothetical protein